MSADLLRRAAAKLRRAANAATPGAWWPRYGGESGYVYSSKAERQVADTGEYSDAEPMPNAQYIALVHPPVILALADWLDGSAAHLADTGLIQTEAEDLARAVLRETVRLP